jgi:hypothetical protein
MTMPLKKFNGLLLANTITLKQAFPYHSIAKMESLRLHGRPLHASEAGKAPAEMHFIPIVNT